MNPASKDIMSFLAEDSSLSLTEGVDLFAGREPATPPNAVTVFDTPGLPPEMFLDGPGGLASPAVQIRVRNVKYLDGWALSWHIREFLHGLMDSTVNGVQYDLIICTQDPFMLDWDAGGRARFVATYYCKRRHKEDKT